MPDMPNRPTESPPASPSRWEARKGSQSSHCCFEATVVDASKPDGYRDHCEPICETFSIEAAQKIAAALNAQNAPRLYSNEDRDRAAHAIATADDLTLATLKRGEAKNLVDGIDEALGMRKAGA